MSRQSRRIRRAMVLLNLMASGYNLAAIWALQMLERGGVSPSLALALPAALLATGLAFALLEWSPPRAPRLALRLGVVLQAVIWAAAIADAPSLQVVVVSLYAAVALWLATRTFLAGEPVLPH